MTVPQARHNLTEQVQSLCLTQPTRLADMLTQIAPRRVFHHNVPTRGQIDNLKDLDHVGVTEVFKQSDLKKKKTHTGSDLHGSVHHNEKDWTFVAALAHAFGNTGPPDGTRAASQQVLALAV